MSENIHNGQCITSAQMNLIFNARYYWRRLSVWTMIYIISRYKGIGTAQELFGRLYLENSNFGDMLQIIFGRNTANQYSDLLNQYSINLRDLISAQLRGDAVSVNQYVNQLYENADARAAYLSSINPYFNQDVWKRLLETYLLYTLEEINQFASEDYKKVIETYDQITMVSNQMGDVFALGVYEYITSGLQCSLTPQGSEQCLTPDQVNSIFDIEMFWFEMIVWMRSYMMGRYYGIGNPEALLSRFRQVAVNYNNRLKVIFGKSEQKDIERDLKLINRHIDLIAALVDANIAGNTDEIGRITEEMYKNANQRAAFLASVNPFWEESEWQNRLYQKMKLILNESTTFLTGDYARNLDILSSLLSQSESTGDYYTQGLLKYISANRSKF